MPNVESFERRLGDALRADADTTIAPFDPASIARAAVQADRAQWGRRVQSRRHGRVPRRMWLLAAAALMVSGGVVVAGSGLLRLTSVVPSETASSLPVVAQVSPTAESSAPSPTPDDGVPATPGMINHARAVLLASDTVGWMATPSAIYRTQDMGRTWTAVQPTGWSAIAIVQFVDTDTMYATSAYVGSDGGPMTLAATHDGGASWVEATIDAPAGMVNMGFSFRTPSNGFATFFTQDGKDVRVYETIDGGATWAGPVRSSAPRMLYLLKEASGDPSAGGHALVLTNALAPGQPFDNNVYFSIDGGVTWATRQFPVSSRARAADMKGATVWVDGSGRVVLAMDVLGDAQLYTSDDDGQSWQFVRDLGRDAGYVQLRSAIEWIVVGNGAVLSTVDGGANWRTIEGASRIFPYAVSFASPDHGWALLSCHDYPAEGFSTYCADPKPGVNDDTVVFLTTTDGGRTWARIGG